MELYKDIVVTLGDSNNILKEKFKIAGLIYRKNKGLDKVFENLLEKAIEEFKIELDSKYDILDFFSEKNGEEIIKLYRTIFSIKEEYFMKDFFIGFQSPKTLNVDWIKENKEYILKTYDNFEEFKFKDEDLIKVGTIYLLESIQEKLSNYEKSFLVRCYPKYFSNRLGQYKQNKEVRDLISRKDHIHFLLEEDKYQVLNDELIEMKKIRDDIFHRIGYNAYAQNKIVMVIENLISELNIED